MSFIKWHLKPWVSLWLCICFVLFCLSIFWYRIADAVEVLCNTAKEHHVDKWFLVIPLIHLLRGESKPYEPVPPVLNPQFESWTGLKRSKGINVHRDSHARYWYFLQKHLSIKTSLSEMFSQFKLNLILMLALCISWSWLFSSLSGHQNQLLVSNKECKSDHERPCIPGGHWWSSCALLDAPAPTGWSKNLCWKCQSGAPRLASVPTVHCEIWDSSFQLQGV